MILLLFLVLTTMPIESDSILINQDTLERIDMPVVLYGMCKGKEIFLSNQAHIVKMDFEGKALARFNSKGPGPLELVGGGPIFLFKGNLWCMDVLAERMLVLNSDLKAIAQKKFNEEPDAKVLNIAPGTDYLYALSHFDPMKRPLFILKIDPNTMRIVRRSVVSGWQAQGIPWPALQMSSMGGDSFAIWENTQNLEYYKVLIWNPETAASLTLKHLTPSRAPKLPSTKGKFYALLLKEGASYLRTVRHGKTGFIVGFDIPKDPNHAVNNLSLDVESMLHVFGENGIPLSTKKGDQKLIDSPGPTDRLLFHVSDVGLIIK